MKKRRSLPKPEKWDVVLIDWIDSAGDGGWGAFARIDKADYERRLSCKTVGYVVWWDAAHVMVCQSFQNAWTDGNPDFTDNRIVIPVCAIQSVEILKKHKIKKG